MTGMGSLSEPDTAFSQCMDTWRRLLCPKPHRNPNELPAQKPAGICYCDYCWILPNSFEFANLPNSSKPPLLKGYLTQGRFTRLQCCFLNRVFGKS